MKTSIDCFASMGVVGGVLSGNTFNTVSCAGLQKDGRHACNRLEYLLLEAGMRNVMPQSTLAVLYDEKLPEDYLLLAMECIKTGGGYPAFMNNQVGDGVPQAPLRSRGDGHRGRARLGDRRLPRDLRRAPGSRSR